MSNLYEITSSIVLLNELLEREEIDQQTYDDTMESVQFALQHKTSNIIKYITNIESQNKAIEEEVERLQNIKKAREKKLTSLKTYIIDIMQKTEQKKIECELGSIAIRKSESLNINDATLIPDRYKRQEITEKIDKNEIKKDIKNGIEIQGTEIITNYSLQVK